MGVSLAMSACHVGDGRGLVGRLLVLEGLLELALPRALAGEGVAGAGLALGVELQELRGHVAHGLLDPLLDLVPAAAAQPVEGGARALRARVLLHAVEGVDRHLELVAALVGEDHELAARAPPTSRVSRPSKRPMPWSWWTTRSPTLRSRKSERKLARRRPPAAAVEVDLLREDVAVGEDAQAGSGSSNPVESAPTRTSTGASSPTARPSSRSTSLRRSARPGLPRKRTVAAGGRREVGGEAAHVARVAAARGERRG